MGQGVIERPTQPLPPFRRSAPSPLSLTGCPGRPPQPLLLRPSSVPFPSSAVAVLERRPARHWPLLAAAPTTRPGKRRDQRPASYRAPLACHRPLLAAAPMPRPGARRRTNVQPATGAPLPTIGLVWSLPLAYHRPLLVATPPAIGLFWSLPLACHRPLMAAALVRGLPARVSRFRRFAERPGFLPFL